MTAPELATQTQGDGPEEPKPITLIGGALNGKKIADYGRNELTMGCGIYRRVRLNAPHGEVFDVMAFYGE